MTEDEELVHARNNLALLQARNNCTSINEIDFARNELALLQARDNNIVHRLSTYITTFEASWHLDKQAMTDYITTQPDDEAVRDYITAHNMMASYQDSGQGTTEEDRAEHQRLRDHQLTVRANNNRNPDNATTVMELHQVTRAVNLTRNFDRKQADGCFTTMDFRVKAPKHIELRNREYNKRKHAIDNRNLAAYENIKHNIEEQRAAVEEEYAAREKEHSINREQLLTNILAARRRAIAFQEEEKNVSRTMDDTQKQEDEGEDDSDDDEGDTEEGDDKPPEPQFTCTLEGEADTDDALYRAIANRDSLIIALLQRHVPNQHGEEEDLRNNIDAFINDIDDDESEQCYLAKFNYHYNTGTSGRQSQATRPPPRTKKRKTTRKRRGPRKKTRSPPTTSAAP